MTFSSGAVRRGRSSQRRPGLIAKRFCSSVVAGESGASITVPSQLMPEKPIAILSMTPSMTEVMTTSAKTPSIRRVSVRVERSLWAQSSTRPPLMISQPSASFAGNDRRRGGLACETAVAGSESACSLIAQRLHRREARGLPCREEGEREAEDRGEHVRHDEALRVDVERDAERRGDDLRKADSDDQARQRADAGQQERLGHELLEDLPAGRADRHLHADLADALLQRRHLDVDVHDAAADERQEARKQEDDVVDVALGLLLAVAGAHVVEAEVLLLAVIRLEQRYQAFAELLHRVDVPDTEHHPVDTVILVALEAAGHECVRNGDDPVAPAEPV